MATQFTSDDGVLNIKVPDLLTDDAQALADYINYFIELAPVIKQPWAVGVIQYCIAMECPLSVEFDVDAEEVEE